VIWADPIRDQIKSDIEALKESFQVIPQPDGPDPARRDKDPLLFQLVGYPQLAVGGLLVSEFEHGFQPALQHDSSGWVSCGWSPEGQVPVPYRRVLEAIKANPGIAGHLTGLRNVAQHFCEPEKPQLVLNDLLFGGHLTYPPDFEMFNLPEMSD
jgi:hypothetical protein